ncbi:MAG TPA: rhamnulokinase [Firmicutes bacterium]|nr:rhamnulokinase [Bacillota bacterium]
MYDYLAIDIGASGGRHILGWVEKGRLRLEEVYRFPNGAVQTDRGLVWDTEALVREVRKGIRRCGELGKAPRTVAIDTWGVDYVLLDGDGKELFPAYAYRNDRTLAVREQAEERLPFPALYARTGIQRQDFNTVYQLFCDRLAGRLDRAAHFLMIPDYLAYRLTGRMKNEYTNATTTSLVNAETGGWDKTVLERFGLPSSLFLPLSQPGEAVGEFTDEMSGYAGFRARVVLCPTHDTASAVAACPLDGRSVYISSGTWSLVGTERETPAISEESRRYNFTNEGGIGRRFRVLKNIMGTWLFQNIRRSLGGGCSYDEMMELAMRSGRPARFDVNHPSLTAPADMLAAVKSLLGRPEAGTGELLNSAYHSLASAYAEAVRELEEITGEKMGRVVIVGGGSRDAYLNRLTAQYTGLPVCTGLQEATATGNILSQLMADRGLGLREARELVQASFDLKEEQA